MDEMPADLLTEALGRVKVEEFRGLLGLSTSSQGEQVLHPSTSHPVSPAKGSIKVKTDTEAG